MSFLNDIWDELEYMTHQELPFINARKKITADEPNQKISLKDIFNYYNDFTYI